VFHRDLKPTNILIRETSDRPVLIDFGIASLGGAACLTETRLPPATAEFRAPEPLRFRRENTDTTVQYEYATTDELWALGVTFYWLLTDVLPFGERTDEGGMEGLHERILNRRPIAPHLVNPRVPLATSRLCMKMLAEWPGDRYATVPELCAALQEALTQAENDATWEVPLADPHDTQVTTTLEDPELREPDDCLRAYRKAGKRRPRRGLVRPRKAELVPPAVQVEQPRAPLPEADPNRIPTVGAPHEAVLAEKHEPPGAHPSPATSVQVMPPHSQLAPPVAVRLSRGPWRLGLAAAVLTLAAVGLSVSAALWGLGSSSVTKKRGGEMTQPSASSIPGSTERSVTGDEVAPAPKPLESFPGEGAAPVAAQPPAPTANAMSAQTKKNEIQMQRAGLRLPVKPSTVAVAAAATCSLLEGGCIGGTAQVRPTPAPVECPADWQATHNRLGIGSGTVVLQGHKGYGGETAPLHDGPVRFVTDDVNGLPERTLLSGTWQLGEGRIYGTFTQAQIPGGGAYPVCLVIGAERPAAMPSGPDCPEGLGFCPVPGSMPGDAKTFVVLDVYPKGYRF
jgi:serine/threonine-protein kinase